MGAPSEQALDSLRRRLDRFDAGRRVMGDRWRFEVDVTHGELVGQDFSTLEDATGWSRRRLDAVNVSTGSRASIVGLHTFYALVFILGGVMIIDRGVTPAPLISVVLAGGYLALTVQGIVAYRALVRSLGREVFRLHQEYSALGQEIAHLVHELGPAAAARLLDARQLEAARRLAPTSGIDVVEQ